MCGDKGSFRVLVRMIRGALIVIGQHFDDAAVADAFIDHTL